VREVDGIEPIPGRVRRPGAGRPPMTVNDPDLVAALRTPDMESVSNR